MPWMASYRARFDEAPSAYSIYGYVILDRLVRAMEATGPQLDLDALVKSIESLKVPADMVGMPELSFGPQQHLGSNKARAVADPGRPLKGRARLRPGEVMSPHEQEYFMHIDRISRFGAAAVQGLAGAAALAQTQGIGKDEITLGSILDLSGPVAGYGKDVRNGLLMGVTEFNAQGGAHGRKLRLLVEDNGYDPKRSVLAAQSW